MFLDLIKLEKFAASLKCNHATIVFQGDQEWISSDVPDRTSDGQHEVQREVLCHVNGGTHCHVKPCVQETDGAGSHYIRHVTVTKQRYKKTPCATQVIFLYAGKYIRFTFIHVVQ